MTSQHRVEGLRVEAPTLEPDPVFLGMLTDLSTRSRSVGPRTARSAGLRMIVATASVAVVATAAWAGGNGMGTPLSPANAPAQQEPSGPPSHGDVATPQRDVSISPGSPVSPGLPGTSPAPTEHGKPAVNDARNGNDARDGRATDKTATKKPKGNKPGKRNEASRKAKARQGKARPGQRATNASASISRSAGSPRK